LPTLVDDHEIVLGGVDARYAPSMYTLIHEVLAPFESAIDTVALTVAPLAGDVIVT
jgi:hypothetical protein